MDGRIDGRVDGRMDGWDVLTLFLWRIDLPPQQSVFQVIFRTIQVGVQPPMLHPAMERSEFLCNFHDTFFNHKEKERRMEKRALAVTISHVCPFNSIFPQEDTTICQVGKLKKQR